jgi:hypothetical protein
MSERTIEEIAGIIVAGTLVFTSASISVKSLDCSCDNRRVLFPNQLVMLMGVLGLVFTLCNCCFEKLDISPYLITMVPGVIALVATISQMYSKCGCCQDDDSTDKTKACADTKSKACCIGSSNLLKLQGLVALLMVAVGAAPMLKEHYEKGSKKLEGGRRRRRRSRKR